MGLVKNDYKFKGYVLPQAYARVQVNTERKEATFYIGASRDTAFSEPIEKVKVYGVPYSHERNPLVEAYEFAKGTYKEPILNSETGKYEFIQKERYFFGWQNDIVK